MLVYTSLQVYTNFHIYLVLGQTEKKSIFQLFFFTVNKNREKKEKKTLQK